MGSSEKKWERVFGKYTFKMESGAKHFTVRVPSVITSGDDICDPGETRRNEGVRLTNKNGDIYIEVLNIDIIRYDLR